MLLSSFTNQLIILLILKELLVHKFNYYEYIKNNFIMDY